MTHGSLFAGIGGFDLGFERAGFKTLWQVEIEPFCQATLKTRFPKAKRFSDICECGARKLRPVDVVTAGFPCQDLSVAGKRAGLAGRRSGLFYQFMRVVDELAPGWVILENVPGLFSSNGGKDFACVLGELTGFFPQTPEEGWRNSGVCVGPKRSAAWRVFDSRYFGVAQRRRRVFVVSGPRTTSAAEVLFERESGSGDSAARRKAGKDVAYAVAAGAGGSKFGSGRQSQDTFIAAPISASRGHHGHSSERGDGCDNLVAATLSSANHDRSHAAGRRREDDFNLVAAPLTASAAKTADSAGKHSVGPVNLVCSAIQGLGDGGPDDNAAQAGHIVIQDVRGHREKRQHGIGITEGGPSYTLSETERHAVAFSENQRGEVVTSDKAHQLSGRGGKPGQGYPAVACAPPDSDGVRDFAGLPEGLDSARYRALGNAVTVQVAEWIARRIIGLEKP